MAANLLPSKFADLEPVARNWALPTEAERNRKRISSTIEELESVYEAVKPRLEEMVEFLNQYPLNDMPPDAGNLLYLGLSLAEIAMPVEVLGQPNMPDSVEDSRLLFKWSIVP